jgi:hypothetical protein
MKSFKSSTQDRVARMAADPITKPKYDNGTDKLANVLKIKIQLPIESTGICAHAHKSQFRLERKLFLDAVKAVRFAMGNEVIKPYYHGIFLTVSRDNICCYAGTGGLFAVKQIKSKVLQDEKKIECFLPTTSIDYIIPSLEASSSPIVTVALSNKRQTCVLTSANAEVQIKNIPYYKFPEMDKVLNYDFPHKLCVNISDLKRPVARIRAAIKADRGYSWQPVDISTDNCPGKMILKYHSASLGSVPLTIDSVVPDKTNSSLMLRCHPDYLAEICNHWPDQTELAISCEINGSKPIVVEPIYKNSIRSNKPDVILFASTKMKEDSANNEVKNENK